MDEPQYEVSQRSVKNIQLTKLPRSCKQAPPNPLSITDLIGEGFTIPTNTKKSLAFYIPRVASAQRLSQNRRIF
ncbi:MAG: hypothetical protein CMN54_04890 [SAR324 cluster bacterium]|uniref:Uncharacterized protein n=1 Tax=SAR324 cluster bacterium TaxID=2024889 RepID=A0A2D6YHY3_9DELT|nr:hypothetical protein [SAR324 cluster bacterium]|tara:strand:- start:203 stop:424 length:222 start_codon:yes stop_codon:yes gene_type:complete